MTDIKVHGLLVVDGDVDNGTPGTANMGKAYDDLLALEKEIGDLQDENDSIGGSLIEAWADTEAAAQAVDIHQSILGIVRDQRDEARGAAGTLYLIADAALKAFNLEPYGTDDAVSEARRELWKILEQSPKWARDLDRS